ncbi:hypothetical protein MKZ38_006312 [Zalerion maritima]|uniref:Uncharacterized protein n=1 Tax=Zalerion maritima TaxID=339359 RepID=A0AAD5WQD0_9PEZI|nr:hypothetical protein MKZ38_006312 [Zalerion maritima]
MSGLDLTAGIIAVLDFSAKVIGILRVYQASFRSAKDDIMQLPNSSGDLIRTPKRLQQLLARPGEQDLKSVVGIRASIDNCRVESKALAKTGTCSTGWECSSALEIKGHREGFQGDGEVVWGEHFGGIVGRPNVAIFFLPNSLQILVLGDLAPRSTMIFSRIKQLPVMPRG